MPRPRTTGKAWARNQAVAEFLVFCMWLDWLACVAPCPSRWPYWEFKRGPVEKLMEGIEFKEPGAG